ncbi:hypothetical protein C3432_20970 [Citrobacter amalonaticus]|uniref:Uncharacterized protein n=1 Tax=Citrobacter amalonaticus TaxID=35703 RepID=A0A2S4RUX2_CITAM|nr:hypothetical protein C3432_20970 [Citrobacter amalonaticus]POT73739.1 hypothetical protein C3436_18435 [Citrobacter amalonaticus]POU63964.1 hypothetical protein C3430_17370 [Citrobacter amalonaticus]POV03597.1 hypothetical protein C3424_20285 [Citrobacter amalonaticus]
MTYRIETRNNYLRVALENLLPRLRNEPEICIIDLASFHSLRAISTCINKYSMTYRYIFIADEGIYSRLLSPIVSLKNRMSVIKYYEAIRHCPGVTYEMVKRRLERHKSMAGYSHKDMTTVYSLLINNSIISAARHIGIRPKLFYRRVDKLVKKLNMVNRLQTHCYFRREFCPDAIQYMINELVRQSIRR